MQTEDEEYVAPLMRSLFSKAAFKQILVDDFVKPQAHPACLLNGWKDSLTETWAGIKEILEGMQTIFIGCLRFVFCVLWYLYSVLRFLTMPVSVPLLVRYHRARKYKQSLAERAERVRLYQFKQDRKK